MGPFCGASYIAGSPKGRRPTKGMNAERLDERLTAAPAENRRTTIHGGDIFARPAVRKSFVASFSFSRVNESQANAHAV
jgi:hypothetical protein